MVGLGPSLAPASARLVAEMTLTKVETLICTHISNAPAR